MCSKDCSSGISPPRQLRLGFYHSFCEHTCRIYDKRRAAAIADYRAMVPLAPMIRSEPLVTVVRVAEPRAHVIVFGNEKGGSGKTTAALHVAVALSRSGFRVGAMDLDLRQKSLSRHLENRAQWMARANLALPSPEPIAIARSASRSLDAQADEESAAFEAAFAA